MRTKIVELESGAPWHLSCTVERVGRDLVCHVHGGDWHVGAVALAQLDGPEVSSNCLVVGIHKERVIAVHAASRLCEATGSSVVCVAGIHFDNLTKPEIADISRAASELADRAASELAHTGTGPT